MELMKVARYRIPATSAVLRSEFTADSLLVTVPHGFAGINSASPTGEAGRGSQWGDSPRAAAEARQLVAADRSDERAGREDRDEAGVCGCLNRLDRCQRLAVDRVGEGDSRTAWKRTEGRHAGTAADALLAAEDQHALVDRRVRATVSGEQSPRQMV